MGSGFLIAGAPPSSGGSSSSVVKSYNNLVPANSTVVVDSIPFINFMSAKWTITITTQDFTLMQTYELLGQGNDQVSPTHVRYGTTGSSINNQPSLSFNVGLQSIDLSIQNEINSAILVHFVRIDLSG